MSFDIIEIQNPENNLYCPHCQHAVLDWDQEQYLQPCEHTLFIAMDLGFEYISDAFESTMQHTVDEIHANDENSNIYDEIVQSNWSNFVIYKANLGVENYYRYIGFSQ